MAQAEINGFSMSYNDQGRGEALFFHHGWISSQRHWRDVASQLADRYRCITFDCRGAGDSDRVTTGHTMSQYASDMVALADELGIGRFTAIGHSMGGNVATQAALDTPDRIERLVLVSSSPSDYVPPEAVQQLIGLSDLVAAGDRAATEGFIRSIWERQDEEQVQEAIDIALACGAEFVQGSIRDLAGTMLAARLGEIAVPAIGITGVLDPFLPGTLAVNEGFEKGTMHVFSRVSHMPLLEVPDELAGVIDDFVASNPPAA